MASYLRCYLAGGALQFFPLKIVFRHEQSE